MDNGLESADLDYDIDWDFNEVESLNSLLADKKDKDFVDKQEGDLNGV